ncbi:MAG: preprotein translocase subunit YajC [Hyphomicrobiales bacterium]|jgi:preprotein translocase subunit YajC
MISKAYAAAQPGGGDVFLQLLPFILIFFIIYFLILRPQQKRVKAHKEMIDNLKKGDSVITQGGLIGKVTKVINEHEIEIQISDDVKVKVIKGMISDLKK